MAKGNGRPNKYERNVEPNLDKVAQMARDMTEEQIAKTLGVSWRSFRDYKKLHPPLVAALKKGRTELVMELKSTLIRKAKGFQYTEKKIIRENGEVVREEEYIRSSLPDVAALNLLLKNYDKENWANDPQLLELRKKEVELHEKQVNASVW